MARVAIIGMGKMGLLHSSTLNAFPDIKLIGFADENKLVRDTFKSLKPEWEIYNDYRELVNSGNLDGVFITTPISSHYDIIKYCIEKNIAFFVEKPAFSTVEQSNLIKENLSNYKAPTLVGYMMRYITTFRKGKKIIDDKIIGDIRSFEGSMYISQLFKKGKGWRYDAKISGGGVIIHQTCHLLDLLNWYLGYPEKVGAIASNWYSKEVEDHAHIIFKYKNNCSGWIDSTWSRHNYRMLITKIHFEGEDGTLTIDDDSLKLYLTKNKGQYQKGWTELNKVQLNKGVEADFGAPYYSIQNRDFINMVKGESSITGRKHDIYESIRLQELINKIYSSINNKGELLTLGLDNES